MDKTFHYSGLANYGAIKSFEVDKKSKDQHVTSSKVLTAVFIGTLSVTSFAVNTPKDNNLFLTNLVDKKIVKKFSNIKNKKSVPLFNKKEVDDMSEKMNATEIKLNEVEKYFNEKISDIKDTVHVIDKKSSVIENELHHINDKISEMNSKFDSIPDMIKETITNTLNEKAVNKKQSFISDYKAPVITGLIVGVLTPVVMLVAAKILGLLH
ncbi:hypothetical protein [Lactococcus lactis]|uniref:hypothetical protein n=1 Tax=Lactococcus lactis TaxID=1358 RepID=UPI00319DB6E8